MAPTVNQPRIPGAPAAQAPHHGVLRPDAIASRGAAAGAPDLSYEQATAILEQIAHLAHAVDPSRQLAPSTFDARRRAATSQRGISNAELRYRALVEKVPAVTFMAALDQNAQELYISPQIQNLLGFTQEEWLADPILWYRQLHPDDRATWGTEFARTCATGVSFRSEYRLLARDGHTVWVHGECQIIADDQGQPRFLLGIAFDITDRKEAESKLQEANRALMQTIQSERETHEALKQAQVALTELNQSLEQRVRERTAELQTAHARLVDMARQAGMAEVASGVLHNVGNILNSVNVSVRMAISNLQQSPITHLCQAIRMMAEHKHDLGHYLTHDERGRHIPDFLAAVAESLPTQQQASLDELNLLGTNVEHIKQIIDVQQSTARADAMAEEVHPVDLLEQAIRVDAAAPEWNNTVIIRELTPTPAIVTDRHLVLQILINLLSNARHAVMNNGLPEKRLVVRSGTQSRDDRNSVRIEVADNGIGIEPENLIRIFNFGFTTKNKGHGFGLHSSANAAKKLGGSLTALSDGPGKGATFILELPIGKEHGAS
jgi:PAS domain S-box-containing protein